MVFSHQPAAVSFELRAKTISAKTDRTGLCNVDIVKAALAAMLLKLNKKLVCVGGIIESLFDGRDWMRIAVQQFSAPTAEFFYNVHQLISRAEWHRASLS